MPTNHTYNQLRELAEKLGDGEHIKISRGTATLHRWGKVLALGFVSVAVTLDYPRKEGQTCQPMKS